MRYHIGCSGWRNVPWRQIFYPASIDVSIFLAYYSSKFDFVEVNLGDSAFGQTFSKSRRQNPEAADNKIPLSVVKRWSEQTPADFHFSIRIPGGLLFAKPLAKLKEDGSPLVDAAKLEDFLLTLTPVKDKVITLTLDVPNDLSLGVGRRWLESVLDICGRHGYFVALQIGNRSWFQDLTYSVLKRHGATIIWDSDFVNPFPSVVSTSNGLYFRIRGGTFNRTSGKAKPPDDTQERIQFSRLVDLIREKEQEGQTDYAIIAVDHPDHAVLLQRMLGIERKSSTSEQSTIVRVHSIIAENDKKNNGRIIACVDLNAFYPSCEELRNPALRGKPHAVIMTDQKQGEITQGVVSSCSYDARKYGVRSAMSLSRAKSLCPDLILLPVDIPYYVKVSEQVMSVLEPFGEVLEQASIDEAFLDCAKEVKSAEDLESLRQYGQRIKQAVKEKSGLLCSVGIASTKSASKIASDYEKPDGLTAVTLSQLKDFLAPLEVSRVSGIGPKTEQALKQMEIMTLGQLANADVQSLVKRFGKNGQWMWKVANGLDDEPVTPRGDHVSISTETTLDSPSRNKEEIQDILYSLANEIYERAMRNGYSYRTAGLKLVRTDFSVETREITFLEPRSDKKSVESIVQPLLDKFTLADKQPAVRKVGIKLSHLSRKEDIANLSDALKQHGSTLQKTLLDYD